MKKALAACFALTAAMAVLPAAQAWKIVSHDVDITLHKEATFDVVEKIVADFGNAQKHGIFRLIPYRYERHMHWMRLDITNVRVVDADGVEWRTKVEYRTSDVWIRVGDPDRTISGVHTYEIRYTVGWAFNYFDDHDELYWNAIGDEWGDCRSIGPSTITVHLPPGTDPDDCGATAFLGRRGEAGAGNSRIDRDKAAGTITFETGQTLRPAEGFTLVVGMPRGTIDKPFWLARAWRFMTNNWPYFLPVLVFGAMLLTWWTRGRDPVGRGTIMVEYEPPDGLTPAEIGTVIDEQVDPRDVSSTLIDLAVRGYLRIEPISEGGMFSRPEVRFVRLKEADDSLADHEKEMFNGLFPGAQKETYLSELREQFYVHMPTIKQDIYSGLVSKGYFSVSPEQVRHTWQGLAVAGAIGGVLSLVFGHEFPLWFAMGIGLLISAVVVFAFSFVMPRKTRKGRICWEKIRGLEEYIVRAEKETLKAAEKQGLFEKLLPYAMALGVADTWARKFEGIYTTPPTWYAASPGQVFTTYWLVGALGRDMTHFSQVSVTRPRTSSSSGAGGGHSGFGGGGFSGGGFGGGGGGSW